MAPVSAWACSFAGIEHAQPIAINRTGWMMGSEETDLEVGLAA
jgi:hypothetical protein